MSDATQVLALIGEDVVRISQLPPGRNTTKPGTDCQMFRVSSPRESKTSQLHSGEKSQNAACTSTGTRSARASVPPDSELQMMLWWGDPKPGPRTKHISLPTSIR